MPADDDELSVTLTKGELRALVTEAVQTALVAALEPDEEVSPYMTTGEAAEILGVSSRTIINMCQAGRVDAVQVGRLWRVRRDSLPRAKSKLHAA